MNYRNANELHYEAGELPYGDQRFYMPRIKLNRALYKEGELIVNHNIYKEGQEIASHNFSDALKYQQPYQPQNLNQPPIDQWQPTCVEDCVFTHIRGAIILYSNIAFDCGVALIVDQLKIFILEVINIFDFWVNLHSWQRIRFAT